MIGTDEMPCGIFNYLPLHCFSVSTSFFLQAVVLGYLLPVNREKLDLLCGWVKSLELGNYGHGFEKQVVYFFFPWWQTGRISFPPVLQQGRLLVSAVLLLIINRKYSHSFTGA